MSIFTDTLGVLRNRWTEEFVDSCVIKSVASQAFNETTGVYVDTYSTTYTGVCLVRPEQTADEDAGQQQAEVRFYSVYVPYTTTSLAPDHLVDVTSTDGYLNGRQLTVRNVKGDSYLAVRQLECEDVENA